MNTLMNTRYKTSYIIKYDILFAKILYYSCSLVLLYIYNNK